MITILKSKIHNAKVTATDINCEGSITLGSSLMEDANITPYEQVHVLDINNGNRFITYAIAGVDGQVEVNGAASRLVSVGDVLIILTYQTVAVGDKHLYELPKIVRL